MWGLVAILAGFVARLVGYSVLHFAAWKLLFWTIAITVFPIVISYAFYSIVSGVITLSTNHVNSALTSGGSSGLDLDGFVWQLTGLAGWMVWHLQLAQALALILSSIAVRVALKMIPFARF